MMYGWPEGTMGEEANKPLNERQFVPTKDKKNKPIAIRKQGSGQRTKDINKMASRVEATTSQATPQEVEEGKTFYYGMHRAGRQIALGLNPDTAISQLRNIPQGSDTVPGKEQHSAAGPALHPSPAHETATRNAVAAIARMSPSQPRGMSWEKNPRAAYDLSKKSDAEVDEMVKAPNLSVARHGALAHVSGSNIAKAHEILSGRSAPEQQIATGGRRIKVGSFFENGADPWGSRAATIDSRSHDITTGKRRGWEDVNADTGKPEDTRRLGAKGRYDMIEEAHQLAGDRMGLQPHAVQAISWLADKRDAMVNSRGGHRKNAQTPLGQ